MKMDLKILMTTCQSLVKIFSVTLLYTCMYLGHKKYTLKLYKFHQAIHPFICLFISLFVCLSLNILVKALCLFVYVQNVLTPCLNLCIKVSKRLYLLSPLRLALWVKFSAGDILKYFPYFSQETGFDGLHNFRNTGTLSKYWNTHIFIN